MDLHSHCAVKAAALAFIGDQLMGKSKKKELETVFKALDQNGDGKLSKEEIKLGYRQHYSFDVMDKEIDLLFMAVDTDESGYIEYTEFLIAAANHQTLLGAEQLTSAFRMFDRDGSGFIDTNEIKQLFEVSNAKVNENFVEAIFKQVDLNGDGRISFEEFTKLMQNVEL